MINTEDKLCNAFPCRYHGSKLHFEFNCNFKVYEKIVIQQCVKHVKIRAGCDKIYNSSVFYL